MPSTEVLALVAAADAWARAAGVVRAGLPRVAGARAAVAMMRDEAFELLFAREDGWAVAGESEDAATTLAFLAGWYSLGSQSFALPRDPLAEAWVMTQPADIIVSALVAPYLRRGLAVTNSHALAERVAVGFEHDPPLWLVLDRARDRFRLRASGATLTPDLLLYGMTAEGDAFDRAVHAPTPVDAVDVAAVDARAPALDMLLGHIQASVAKRAVPGANAAELAAALVNGVADAIAGRPLEERGPIDWLAVARALGLASRK